MKDWQRIRRDRTDITDYVIHFTKNRLPEFRSADQVFFRRAGGVFEEILDDGFVRPTFAAIKSKVTRTTSNTVRGPEPAVCLTEQPLSAAIVTQRCSGGRYSGFGIAYHKYALFEEGGRPVIYGPASMLGKCLKRGDAGYQEGKDIYIDGIPAALQYLCVRYKPTVGDWDEYPIDFTWEREWRVKCNGEGLPVYLDRYSGVFKPEIPICALVVEEDRHVDTLRDILQKKASQGVEWAAKLTKFVSLETVARMLEAGDERYARIETYPE